MKYVDFHRLKKVKKNVTAKNIYIYILFITLIKCPSKYPCFKSGTVTGVFKEFCPLVMRILFINITFNVRWIQHCIPMLDYYFVFLSSFFENTFFFSFYIVAFIVVI